jgi:hypothetical protein
MVKGKKVGMAWNAYKVGDSWIVKFLPTYAKDMTSNRALMMPLCTSLNRQDHVGQVSGMVNLNDESKLRPLLETVKCSNVEIHSFGKFLWLRKNGERHILLPKDFVKQLALFVVGLPRSPATLALLVSKAKKMVKKMNIPADMQLNCATYGAAFAFVHTLQDEIVAYNNLCDSFLQRLYRQLSTTLTLNTMLPACCTPFCGSTMTVYETAQAYANDRSSLPGPCFDASKAWPDGLPGYESQMPLKKLKVGAKLGVFEREEMEEKPQFFPIATTFSNYIPLVPYSSQNNEVVSLHNRACVITPKEDEEGWKECHAYTKRMIELLEIEPNVTLDYEAEFEEWNSRYPTAKQKKRVIAWESLKTQDLGPEDFIRNQFVKRELTMKGGPEPEDFDPRSIQGNSDRLAVSYGPFCSKLSKKVAEKWNKDHRIYYVSGATAEDVGEWRKQFHDYPVTLLECDMSRFDSCQGEGCYKNAMLLAEKFGIKEHEFACKAYEGKKCIQGYSAHGVKYRVPYTMPSGSDDTTIWNSFNNATTLAFILDYISTTFGVRDNWKMVVLGDDALVVWPEILSCYLQEKIVKVVRQLCLRLGLNAKPKVSNEWFEVEFCSSLFWPVKGGYVLGPKLGKRLPKIGFSLRRLNEGEVKGMILGLRFEAGFLPVFSQYIEHHLKLLRHVVAVEHKDERSLYKALPAKKHTATEDTELFFQERYGMSAALAISEFTQALKGVHVLTACVDYWPLTHFVVEDL